MISKHKEGDQKVTPSLVMNNDGTPNPNQVHVNFFRVIHLSALQLSQGIGLIFTSPQVTKSAWQTRVQSEIYDVGKDRSSQMAKAIWIIFV